MAKPTREQLAEGLHRAALRLLRDLRRVDVEAGIGPARLSALSVLVFGGPRSVGELAAAEGVTRPTMTRVVQGLVEQGLAARRADPEDGRRVRVTTTTKGRRRMLAARERRLARLRERLRALSEPEARRLWEAVEVMERLSGGR